MNKPRVSHINRLGMKLTLCALLSVCVALAVFFIAQAFSNHILDNISSTVDFDARRNERLADRVQAYVEANGLRLYETDKLWAIPGASENFLIMLSSDGQLIDADGEISYPVTDAEVAQIYPIAFADGEAQVYLWDYSYYTSYYRISDAVCGTLAFLAFVILFVCLIRKKLRYILQLERELSILEGGDLDYPITVQGNDELGNLARGIDDMRRSFIERQEGEAEAIRANQALVTAMSHDLRTPLTSLLGYIELIQSGQYESEAQLRHFISASRDKVYRIKEMTDALFTYALCSGDETPAQLKCMDAYELFSQLLTEHGFELESAGFKTALTMSVFRASIQVDPARMARVFDNLSSNIKKYADPRYPIEMELGLQGACHIRIKNRASAGGDAESNRIGLKTCEKILQQHKGSFSAKREGDWFTVTMTLPFWNRK